MTTTDTAPPLARRRLTQAQFGAEAIRRFGALADLWLFRCPLCGHTQAAADLPTQRQTHVAQVCFGCGFLAEEAAGPSLERLWVVVLPGGTVTDSFPLADDSDSGIGRDPSRAPLATPGDPSATPGPASAPDAPGAAVGPGNSNHAPTDETPVPCEACLSRPAVYDGDLCGPCYNAAVDRELSCDWLPANDDGAEAEA